MTKRTQSAFTQETASAPRPSSKAARTDSENDQARRPALPTAQDIWALAETITGEWQVVDASAFVRLAVAVMRDNPDELSRVICLMYARVGIWPTCVSFKLDLDKELPRSRRAQRTK